MGEWFKAMKDGLVFENGELFYYRDGVKCHAGIIKVDGDIYYIGKGGKAVKGYHVVHRGMTGGILNHGTYKFGDDYKLIEDSYVAPKRLKRTKKKRSKGHKGQVDSNKVNLVIIIIAVVVIVGLLLLAAYGGLGREFRPDNNSTTAAVSGDAKITLPNFEGEVVLCSNSAKEFYDGTLSAEQAVAGGNPYRPFAFEYVLEGANATLSLSENSDFSDSKEFVMLASQTSVSIDNLKTDTTYYYKVVLGEDIYQGSFKTAKSPRFISMPGVHNVRDIGGYETLDGKTVKQGYIIRGSEADGLVESTYFLDSKYVESIMAEFGFVYDFDLRYPTVFKGENYVSRFGSEVGHCFYNAPAYGQAFSSEYDDELKQIFSDLANPDNYPMYLHCSHGADRTGTIVFLLQGLLNVSEKDMLTEYRLTGFSGDKSYATSNKIDIIISGLEGFNGETLQEKIVDYLLTDIGVTQEEIDSIRNILLED